MYLLGNSVTLCVGDHLYSVIKKNIFKSNLNNNKKFDFNNHLNQPPTQLNIHENGVN